MNNCIKTIFLLTFVVSLQSLSGMDQPGALMQGNDLVFDLVFTNYLQDHVAICSFAATSKDNDKYILATAKQRKNLLLPHVYSAADKNVIGMIWHKYGSARCCAYKDKTVLKLAIFYLESKEKYCRSFHSFYHFISALPHKPAPFFNKEGELCFHGYGMIDIVRDSDEMPLSVKLKRVVRYDNNNKALRCVMYSLGNDLIHYSMNYFLEYPFLLEAILRSEIVKELHRKSHNMVALGRVENFLAYYLDGVTLPDNYAERHSLVDLPDKLKTDSFEDFPGFIKDAITTRYKGQPKNDVDSTS